MCSSDLAGIYNAAATTRAPEVSRTPFVPLFATDLKKPPTSEASQPKFNFPEFGLAAPSMPEGVGAIAAAKPSAGAGSHSFMPESDGEEVFAAPKQRFNFGSGVAAPAMPEGADIAAVAQPAVSAAAEAGGGSSKDNKKKRKAGEAVEADKVAEDDVLAKSNETKNPKAEKMQLGEEISFVL